MMDDAWIRQSNINSKMNTIINHLSLNNNSEKPIYHNKNKIVKKLPVSAPTKVINEKIESLHLSDIHTDNNKTRDKPESGIQMSELFLHDNTK
jgi:hypothetical protein